MLGVSPDPVPDLRAFADRYGLAFTLLADEGGEVAQRYDARVEKHRDGRTYFGNERSSVLVDPEGNVARVFSNVKPDEHDDLVLGALRDLPSRPFSASPARRSRPPRPDPSTR